MELADQVEARLVAEGVALVDDSPEHACAGLPGEAHGIAQAGGEEVGAQPSAAGWRCGWRCCA